MTTSRFSDLEVKLADPLANGGTGQWQLTAPLVYESDMGGRIEVPTGFSTDFASVPHLIITYGLMGNRAHRPAVVHDYVTRERLFERHKCDAIFLEAMLHEGIDPTRARLMYAAVAAYTATGIWRSEADLPDSWNWT
jgi:hypothetical protein